MRLKKCFFYTLDEFNQFILIHKTKVLILGFIYLLAFGSIGMTNVPYIDDIARQNNGATDFAWSYSRWGSELAAWLTQGGKQMVDLGVASFILSAMILLLSSWVVLFSFNIRGKVSWSSVLASSLIGLNPWFLQCLSFRFDNPFMSLSVLFALLPFVFWRSKKPIIFYLSTVIGIFLMCNTYQASSGIYIVMVIFLSLIAWLDGYELNKIFKKIVLSAFSFILAMGLYYIETKFNPDLASRVGTTQIAKLKEMPHYFITHSNHYLKTMIEQSSKAWIVLFILLILLLISVLTIHSAQNLILSFIVSIIAIILAMILSYGILLIFVEPLYSWNPRYAYGFFTCIAIMACLLSSRVTIPWQIILSTGVTMLLFWYVFSFTFVYSAALEDQDKAFEQQSILLAQDLKTVMNDQRNAVSFSKMFKDSILRTNAEKRYPLISKLIPSNQDTYWPHQLLFSKYAHLPLGTFDYDYAKFDESKVEKVVNNSLYDIYVNDTQIFVIPKY